MNVQAGPGYPRGRPATPHVLIGYDESAALWQLRAHGVVSLRDPAGKLEDFIALTDAIMETLPHHSVATKERDAVPGGSDVATVNKGQDAIPLHRESSFLPTQPDMLAFYCQEPPAAGGETTLCDGVRLLAAFPREVRSFIENETLIWRFRLPLERWTVALGTRSPEIASRRIQQLMSRAPQARYEFSFPEGPDGCLDGTYCTPLVLPTHWGNVPAFANSLLGYYYRQPGPLVARHLHHATISGGRPFPADILETVNRCAEQLIVEVRWQAGDALLVDNSHVMHGRRAVVDQQRRILVRLGNYLPELAARA